MRDRPPRLLTAKEVAAMTNLHEDTVYELYRKGHLPAVRIGLRGVRFAAPVVTAWIERGGVKSAGPPRVGR